MIIPLIVYKQLQSHPIEVGANERYECNKWNEQTKITGRMFKTTPRKILQRIKIKPKDYICLCCAYIYACVMCMFFVYVFFLCMCMFILCNVLFFSVYICMFYLWASVYFIHV